MPRKIIGTSWDRDSRNSMNGNFEELYMYKQTADDAKEIAERAETKANSVQAQFDEVIIEGDSSVEAAQARYTEDGRYYRTLQQRLNDADRKRGDITLQVAQAQQDLQLVENKSNLNSIINRSKMEYISLINGQNDWLNTTWRPATPDGDWIFEDNSIKPTFVNLTTGGVANIHKHKRIQDGEIGVTIKGYDINATSNSGAGIIFKGKNTGDYVVAMILFNLKQVWVGTLKNGVYQNVRTADISNSQIIPKNGESINFSVITYGNVFSVFLNGSEILKNQVSSYINPQESNGLWGLFIYNGTTNVDTFVKDIVFSNLYTKEYDYSTLPSKIERILYCGDSLTFGAGVTVEERWTNLLDVELRKTYPNLFTENVAVSGAPTSGVLDQVTNYVAGEDIVFILTGTNNARIDSVGTTISEAIADLKYMIQLSKAYGVIPIISTCPPMDRTKNTVSLNATSWAWITEFNNHVRRLCAIEKVICVDFYNDFNNDLALLQADKLHPTAEGHQLMFNTAHNTVIGKIRKF